MLIRVRGTAITNFEELRVGSPKRHTRFREGWEGFFPYYAGFPEKFASDLLASSKLAPDSTVLDPWNGSGTTTYSAARLGHRAVGLDINPVMVVVARARMLPPSEADALLAAANTVKTLFEEQEGIDDTDPLLQWFGPGTATAIRAIERSICAATVGQLTLTDRGVDLGRISGLAATLYVSLFDVCRHLTAKYRSSNPTWLRNPRKDVARVGAPQAAILSLFASNVEAMVSALGSVHPNLLATNTGWQIELADSVTTELDAGSIDCVLTSPPYCTRIDYTAATRIELAVLASLVKGDRGELSRRMIGSIRVPVHEIEPMHDWGDPCLRFLKAVKAHSSKASGTYYYRTHLDYFDKMSKSLATISAALKDKGLAILVVQDSYYKELHNDLPAILTDMAASRGLHLGRRVNFQSARSMARINRHTKVYGRSAAATEAVLCFEKAS